MFSKNKLNSTLVEFFYSWQHYLEHLPDLLPVPQQVLPGKIKNKIKFTQISPPWSTRYKSPPGPRPSPMSVAQTLSPPHKCFHQFTVYWLFYSWIRVDFLCTRSLTEWSSKCLSVWQNTVICGEKQLSGIQSNVIFTSRFFAAIEEEGGSS